MLVVTCLFWRPATRKAGFQIVLVRKTETKVSLGCPRMPGPDSAAEELRVNCTGLLQTYMCSLVAWLGLGLKSRLNTL